MTTPSQTLREGRAYRCWHQNGAPAAAEPSGEDLIITVPDNRVEGLAVRVGSWWGVLEYDGNVGYRWRCVALGTARFRVDDEPTTLADFAEDNDEDMLALGELLTRIAPVLAGTEPEAILGGGAAAEFLVTPA